MPVTNTLRVIFKCGKHLFVPANLEGLTGQSMLTLVCPRCGNNISVGSHKGIRFRLLEKAIPFVWNDGFPDKTEVIVNVQVPFVCDCPNPSGKGRCGLKMIIRGNRVGQC